MSTVVENGKDVRRFSKSFKEGKNLPTQKTLKELSSFEKQLIKESLHEYGEVTLEESTYSELTGYSYRRTTYKVEDKIDQGEEGSLEDKIESEQIYITRFEKEGKFMTWNNVILKSAFFGLCGTFAIDTFTDSPYALSIGSLAFSLPAIYVFYKEAKKKVTENEYTPSSIFG